MIFFPANLLNNSLLLNIYNDNKYRQILKTLNKAREAKKTHNNISQRFEFSYTGIPLVKIKSKKFNIFKKRII